MITREQIYTMLLMQNRKDSVFSKLPTELIQEISDYGQAPKSDLAKALKYAAFARQKDVDKLIVEI